MEQEVKQEVEQKPVKEKKVKVVKEPRLSDKWTPEKWASHLASMTVQEVPEGYVIMSDIVKNAVELGVKKSRICSAMGGDRAANAAWDPIFQVVYVGGRKYGSSEILTKGIELLNDPEFHKPVRKGRQKKEKIEGERGGKKISLKKVNSEDKVWVAKGSIDPRTGEVKQ
jgi:hypothetical protein